jgi:hypothetical protein
VFYTQAKLHTTTVVVPRGSGSREKDFLQKKNDELVLYLGERKKKRERGVIDGGKEMCLEILMVVLYRKIFEVGFDECIRGSLSILDLFSSRFFFENDKFVGVVTCSSFCN